MNPENMDETSTDEPTETVTPDTQQTDSGEMPPHTDESAKPKTVEELQAELESVQNKLHDANRQAAKRRKELDAFEKAKKESEDAEKTELQKAQEALEVANKKLEESQSVARRHTLLAAVRGAGQRLKVLLDEDALGDLFDAGRFSKVETDEAGEPQNVEAFLKELIKAKPYILQNRASAPDINSQDGGDKGKGEVMSDDEIKERARRFGLRV